MKSVIRNRLLASSLLASVGFVATPAFAQSAETNQQEETADIGDPASRLCAENPNSPDCANSGTAIVVTGSRIASPTLTATQPLQVVDAQDIDDSGVVNLQSVLLENPAFGTPGVSRTNSNFSTSSVGVATVDLRNLGSDRTLVLVNSRRFVAGIPSSATVDLNTIPTQFIERVDILTGGASSVYGSDAVAGVVNIIYKTDFEGIEASGQLGISERGDDFRQQANLIMGANLPDGRGNVMAFFGYSDEGAVFSRDRKRSAVDQISTALLTGDPADFFDATVPFFSSFAPQGTFQIRAGQPGLNLNPCPPADQPQPVGCNATFTDPGEFAPVVGLTRTFDPITGAFVTASTNGSATRNPTGFNRSAFRTIAVPTERYLIALRGNYEVVDDINLNMEGTFAQTRTTSELEPFPLGSDDIFPASGGRFAVESRGPDGTLVRNPLVPDNIFNLALDTRTIDTNGDGVADAGDGLRDIGFTRRLLDFGPRGNTANRTTFRILTGLDGKVFGNFNWDVFYAYGETTEAQRGNGQVNVLNFANALNVIPDEFGNPICADANARAQGCVPADVFNGALRISPAAARYIAAPQSRTTRTTQQLAGANLSGELFQLIDAPLGIAIGTEYRKEFSEENNDALTEAGLNGGNALPSSSGSFDVIEGYGELQVPIFRDRPFFQDLTLRGAVRVSDYSTVGTTYSYSGGIDYAPIRDIRFRGTYSRATRAPNIGELFTPPSQTFPTGLQDPCSGVTATTGGTLGAQCLADAGVRANIAANGGVFTLNQSDIQGVSGFNRGNPDLGEEEADTYTAGVVINPRSINALRNFSLTVDYYNIEIADAIVGTPRQFALDQCFRFANQQFCDFISRRQAASGPNSAGSLEFIDSAASNSGGLKTTGIDTVLSYRQNFSPFGVDGQINARVAYTHVFKAFTIPLPGADRNSFNEEIGAADDKVFASLGFNTDQIGIVFRGNYIAPSFLDDQFLAQFDLPARDPAGRIKEEFYLSSQIRFTPGEHYEFYVGVDNLLDNEPPRIISGLPGNNTGTESDAGTYDVLGRRFYAGARIRF